MASNLKANVTENKKIADLERDMVDAHSSQNTTTDHGTKVHDVDHWLKNVDPKSGRVGSHYLEDQIGRERVCFPQRLQNFATDFFLDPSVRSRAYP